MHHVNPMVLIHSLRVGMIHQCSAGELLASTALVHHPVITGSHKVKSLFLHPLGANSSPVG